MTRTQIRIYHSLIFCYNETSHSCHKTHLSTRNVKMTFCVAISLWTYIGRIPNLLASISHIFEKAVKQKKPLNLIFKNIEWQVTDLRKVYYNNITCFIALGSPLFHSQCQRLCKCWDRNPVSSYLQLY